MNKEDGQRRNDAIDIQKKGRILLSQIIRLRNMGL